MPARRNVLYNIICRPWTRREFYANGFFTADKQNKKVLTSKEGFFFFFFFFGGGGGGSVKIKHPWLTGSYLRARPLSSVDSGGTYAHSLSRDTPYLGNSVLRAFPHNIHPLFRELFPIDSNSGTLWLPLFLFFYFLSFLRAPEICVRILSLPSRGPSTDMRCAKGPVPLSPCSREAFEGSGLGKHVYV